jgi:hypothetical protein
VVVGPNGEQRISMQVAGHGVADIALVDAQERNQAELRVTPQGEAAIGFDDVIRTSTPALLAHANDGSTGTKACRRA